MLVSREQLVRRAGLEDDFVHRLHELRALRGSDDAYEERDVHLAALLRMWERAGLSAPTILAAVDAGTLSLDFLDSPAWERPEPLPITYRQLAEEHGIPLHLLQGIQADMGFADPDPDDGVRPDDAVLAELTRILRDLGASDEGIPACSASTPTTFGASRWPKVPADAPSDATVLIDSIDPVPNYDSHRWAPIQMWGRQPG